MRYQAILFDLDGTLIQTEDLYLKACLHAMKRMKIEFNEGDYHRLFYSGYPLVEWLRQLGADTALEQEVRSIRDKCYQDLLRTEVTWYPEAQSVLRDVASSKETAVITGSWRSYLEAMEERIPLKQYTDVIIDGDHTWTRPKPDPYGLKLACKQLKVDPQECIYVGNQAIDVTAAQAAGMASCIVKRAKAPADEGRDADIVVESLEELMGIVS